MRGWLKQRLIDSSRRMRLRSRLWLKRHPRTRRFLTRTGSLEVDEFTLARGTAVGLFIGLTPTVGVQTLLMLGASIVLRANFPAAFLVSWISNPLTLAPLYFLYYSFGEYLMRFLPIRFESLSGLEAELAQDTSALILGSLCIAVPAALCGYVLFLYVWRRFDLHLPRRVELPVDADAAAAPGRRD